MDEIIDDFVVVSPDQFASPHSTEMEDTTNVDHTSTNTTKLTTTHPNNKFTSLISKTIGNLSPILRKISLSIHDNPELNYKEHHAHDTLVSFFSGLENWKVIPHAYNISTAFIAIFDSKRPGPVVSFNAEYDALPGIGHACGHNLIAIASISAALATKATVEKFELGGKVILFGTPAEEGGGGKIQLLNQGAYKDFGVDVSLISHPGITEDSALMRTAAYKAFKVEYKGKEAHAAAAPWEGINALDGLIVAYNGLSVLRQQTQAGDIIQGCITNGGVKPNIIHAYASGNFVVRAPTSSRLSALYTRVVSCFQGAATATGTTLTITPQTSYLNHIPNRVLASRYTTYFNSFGGNITATPELQLINAATQASTDQGDISHAMPSLSPGFWIRSEGEDGEQRGGPHTPDFAAAARKIEAHGLALRVGKGLAGTAVDVLTVDGLLEEIKKEFEEQKAEGL